MKIKEITEASIAQQNRLVKHLKAAPGEIRRVAKWDRIFGPNSEDIKDLRAKYDIYINYVKDDDESYMFLLHNGDQITMTSQVENALASALKARGYQLTGEHGYSVSVAGNLKKPKSIRNVGPEQKTGQVAESDETVSYVDVPDTGDLFKDAAKWLKANKISGLSSKEAFRAYLVYREEQANRRAELSKQNVLLRQLSKTPDELEQERMQRQFWDSIAPKK